MRILVIGGGGREHALAWKAAQSPRVECVYVAPGNAGTACETRCENIPVGAADIPNLLAFAREHHIDLTLVGPEAPLAEGIADAFAAAGLACFGPSRAAARIEASKAYAKRFCERHGIPSARARCFTDPAAARAALLRWKLPVVIKADGLAAGKGVVIAETREQALATADAMLSGQAFGAAGREIVVEDHLPGDEVSYIVLAHGKTYLCLATSQDHKRVGDGDTGPNTGGMGAYSPAPLITSTLAQRIEAEIIQPTLAGLAAEGITYSGFLYAGIMVGPRGTPRVLEFNCRLGDPETQPLLMRLDSDLIELVTALLHGNLEDTAVTWKPQAAVGVVLASAGYPGDYKKGRAITGLETPLPEGVKIFHAGTTLQGGKVLTAGGRVLCVTALGKDIATARNKAYAGLQPIHFDGIQYRHDIAHRALNEKPG